MSDGPMAFCEHYTFFWNFQNIDGLLLMAVFSEGPGGVQGGSRGGGAVWEGVGGLPRGKLKKKVIICNLRPVFRNIPINVSESGQGF